MSSFYLLKLSSKISSVNPITMLQAKRTQHVGWLTNLKATNLFLPDVNFSDVPKITKRFPAVKVFKLGII